jgi:hypothetical protein
MSDVAILRRAANLLRERATGATPGRGSTSSTAAAFIIGTGVGSRVSSDSVSIGTTSTLAPITTPLHTSH